MSAIWTGTFRVLKDTAKGPSHWEQRGSFSLGLSTCPACRRGQLLESVRAPGLGAFPPHPRGALSAQGNTVAGSWCRAVTRAALSCGPVPGTAGEGQGHVHWPGKAGEGAGPAGLADSWSCWDFSLSGSSISPVLPGRCSVYLVP